MTAKINDTVSFKAGPKSTGLTTAKVTADLGRYLETTDDAGKVRKILPSSVTVTKAA